MVYQMEVMLYAFDFPCEFKEKVVDIAPQTSTNFKPLQQWFSTAVPFLFC